MLILLGYIIFLLFSVFPFCIVTGETKHIQFQDLKASSAKDCNVINAKEFKNRRLNKNIWKAYCGRGEGECFVKCLFFSSCRSFAVVNNMTCASQCLLYTETSIDEDSLLMDVTASYYFLESKTCCNSNCLNDGICDSKSCTCQCAKGYSSKNCICLTRNLSRQFSSLGKQISGEMVQVDSGEQTWAVDKNDGIWMYSQQTENWAVLNGGLKHVSRGKAGLWGVNRGDYIYFREDVSSTNPLGKWWRSIPGLLKQIDSGSSGAVYGVYSNNSIFCRSGISIATPYGTGWVAIVGYKFKYVSCGDYGCWAIKPDNSILFRTGITADSCQGVTWLNVDGYFVQLDSGLTGSVYAISPEYELYTRQGICAVNPTGTKWKRFHEGRFKHVTVGNSNLIAIAENGTIIVF